MFIHQTQLSLRITGFFASEGDIASAILEALVRGLPIPLRAQVCCSTSYTSRPGNRCRGAFFLRCSEHATDLNRLKSSSRKPSASACSHQRASRLEGSGLHVKMRVPV